MSLQWYSQVSTIEITMVQQIGVETMNELRIDITAFIESGPPSRD